MNPLCANEVRRADHPGVNTRATKDANGFFSHRFVGKPLEGAPGEQYASDESTSRLVD